jgi:2-dehydropantoate 2-reductase
VILLCVKSAQTEEAGRTLSPIVGKNAVIVSMQNGVGNAGVLRKAMPGAIVLGGIVGFNVVSKAAGAYQRGTTGPLVIELPGEAGAVVRVDALATALRHGGFEVELPADIRPKQWSKLIMNLNNAVSALSGAPTPDLIFKPGYRRVVRAIIGEALNVLAAAKIRPARLGAIPVGLFPTMLSLPTPVLRVVARAQLKMDPEARSSMWEDLTRGRATEVDYLNGEIVSLAGSSGVQAPLNARIVTMVHAAEKEKKGSPGLSPEALWSALTASSPA